ncbi:unnamed protein product [Nesidiocoris tenuis]|uniref:Uncharacterized protein n=1 Tax=Nesidiocoris tenuis TaxID=355587 RepID=A0A6H5H6K9_9HEMI|nr:unnamed protein product [Nesidiocoris tenuis]
MVADQAFHRTNHFLNKCLCLCFDVDQNALFEISCPKTQLSNVRCGNQFGSGLMADNKCSNGKEPRPIGVRRSRTMTIVKPEVDRKEGNVAQNACGVRLARPMTFSTAGNRTTRLSFRAIFNIIRVQSQLRDQTQLRDQSQLRHQSQLPDQTQLRDQSQLLD